MEQLYSYVGPKEIAERSVRAPVGVLIASSEDVRQWIRQTAQDLGADGTIIATFIVDEAGRLRIADRRSEHVACAGGERVRSAGEMTFAVRPNGVTIVWVTNQSTGYCPEPDSWPAVQVAATRAGFSVASEFSQALAFRRCPHCGVINLIKDAFFTCMVCAAPMPKEWNLASRPACDASIQPTCSPARGMVE